MPHTRQVHAGRVFSRALYQRSLLAEDGGVLPCHVHYIYRCAWKATPVLALKALGT